MRIEDGLVVALALATGGVLLAGLARALDSRPRLQRPPSRVGVAAARVPDAIEPPVADRSQTAPVVAEAEPGPPAETAASAQPLASAVPVPPAESLASTEPLAATERLAAEAGPSDAPASEVTELRGPAAAPVARVVELACSPTEAAVGSPDELDLIPLPASPPTEAAGPGEEPETRQMPMSPDSTSPTGGPAAAPSNDAEPAEMLTGAVAATPVPDLSACLRAYEAGDHAATESAALALARKRGPGKRAKRGDGDATPLEQVALWSALALCRRARGDEAGATAAFEAGARWAGAVATRRASSSAVGLAPTLGRDLLAAAEAMPDAAASRQAALRLASTWLGAAAAASPGDGDAAALAERAGNGFTAAVAVTVAERIADRDFGAAQETVERALAGVAVPEERRAELRDLPWTSITGEIGRLVGQALHGAGDPPTDDPIAGGSRASGGMAALTAAARVVAAIPPDALTSERHQDLARRLWWAHLQLGGELRVRGELDEAVAPLLRALELATGDPAREAEVREAVALVIEALAVRLGEEIRERLRLADLDGAMTASRRLGAVVDDALSRGLAPADLAGALARRQEVLLELAEGRPAGKVQKFKQKAYAVEKYKLSGPA